MNNELKNIKTIVEKIDCKVDKLIKENTERRIEIGAIKGKLNDHLESHKFVYTIILAVSAVISTTMSAIVLIIVK